MSGRPMTMVAKALNALDRAREDYGQACGAAFPIGTRVMWAHGSQERVGVVVDRGGLYGERLRVESDVWERTYWIDAARVVRYWADSNVAPQGTSGVR